jgi:hypothetical protein
MQGQWTIDWSNLSKDRADQYVLDAILQ